MGKKQCEARPNRKGKFQVLQKKKKSYNGLSISLLFYIIREFNDTKSSFTRLCVYGIGQMGKKKKKAKQNKDNRIRCNR